MRSFPNRELFFIVKMYYNAGMTDPRLIRNFCIIAHIDHGKSTFADRMLEITRTIEARKMRSQFLDQMDLERERGITIKMQPVRMHYRYENDEYIFNLIDTPGHIDFNYEVSRALLAVEGVILLVDATQGVQAQTITNLELARKHNLVIVPVINKIDMADARIEETKEEIMELLQCDPDEILLVSAKTGEGVVRVLETIVKKIPSPNSASHFDSLRPHHPPVREGFDADSESQRLVPLFTALIFDSHYSPHKGVLAYVRVFEGSLEPKRGLRVKLFHKQSEIEPVEVGVFTPTLTPEQQLSQGEIGYIATNLKDPAIVRVGDTIGDRPVPGYEEPRPVVWASIYPQHADEFEKMKDALLRLRLNDAALSFEVEGSHLLGRSLRVGFLGMLHLEITVERLSREFDIEVIVAQPSIEYVMVTKDNIEVPVRDAESFDALRDIREMHEPWFLVSVVARMTDMGAIMDLVQKNKGNVVETKSLVGSRIFIAALVPLRKLVTNFFDDLKGATQGYGSLSYEFGEYRLVDLVALHIHIAEKDIPQFARLLPHDEVEYEARKSVEKLYDILPRQMFALKIHAVLQGRIIASRTLPAMAKNVTAKLYGGDRSRKMKLWKKQKEGKKRLTAHSNVDIPQEIYLKMIGR